MPNTLYKLRMEDRDGLDDKSVKYTVERDHIPTGMLWKIQREFATT